MLEKIALVNAQEREQERDHQRPRDDPEQSEHRDASEQPGTQARCASPPCLRELRNLSEMRGVSAQARPLACDVIFADESGRDPLPSLGRTAPAMRGTGLDYLPLLPRGPLGSPSPGRSSGRGGFR